MSRVSRNSANTKGGARGIETEDLRDLEVLNAVAADRHITQRGLAAKLGIAVGLTNLYIKRLARKGYIKCVNIDSNRLLYLITPRGVAEKTRLTYEYMSYSLSVYREVRTHLRVRLRELATSANHIAIYWRGEAAELAYLSLREAGIEPAAVFDVETGGHFLGMTVVRIHDHERVSYDLMIVASFEPSKDIVDGLIEAGVPPHKLVTLRPHRMRRKWRARAPADASV
jgi:ribosomal protein S25